MKIKNILNFLFEIGTLRNVARTGWSLAQIPLTNTENVAEHSLRVAQIAYILAKMEDYKNPYEVVTMAIFHDSHETRVYDPNKVMRRYVQISEVKAAEEQYKWLADINIDNKLENMWSQVNDKSTEAGIIVKDADYLECAISAVEYKELGYNTNDWINNVGKALKTTSAKKLFAELKNVKPTNWWKGLKKLD